MDLDQLKAEVIRFRDDRNWGAINTVKNLAIALSIEAAELNEVFLWKTDSEVSQLLLDACQRKRFEDEMADVLIYLLALANDTQTDLVGSVRAKLRKNSAKYPIQKIEHFP